MNFICEMTRARISLFIFAARVTASVNGTISFGLAAGELLWASSSTGTCLSCMTRRARLPLGSLRSSGSLIPDIPLILVFLRPGGPIQFMDLIVELLLAIVACGGGLLEYRFGRSWGSKIGCWKLKDALETHAIGGTRLKGEYICPSKRLMECACQEICARATYRNTFVRDTCLISMS
ncbi:hypothetical protein BJ878DRAFT_128664 [Calycina marina]|uniref:Uncharacterized protein n=1 Tax=Calycina marina TaxID=1763456 RepID=A0A9P7Z0R0_9HELO|nr:hypothetical protein BJ878DRAFT_128664 [Calycina marina]